MLRACVTRGDRMATNHLPNLLRCVSEATWILERPIQRLPLLLRTDHVTGRRALASAAFSSGPSAIATAGVRRHESGWCPNPACSLAS